jgi:hypothetical protein
VNEHSLMVSVLNDSLDEHNGTKGQESGACAFPPGQGWRFQETGQGS